MSVRWEPTSGHKGEVCSLAYELAVIWCRRTFIQMTQVNSCNGFSIDDSTIQHRSLVILHVLLLLLLLLLRLTALSDLENRSPIYTLLAYIAANK